jgi:transcriptional regulator with XRE-family HTH domain
MSSFFSLWGHSLMIGTRIREYRKKKGLKLIELAKIIGISHGSLSDIETEKTDPSTETVLKFVRNTDINLAWLFTGDGPMVMVDYPNVVAEPAAYYIPELDEISAKILILLKEISEEERREFLRNLEDKKQLREMIEERRKLKDTG